MTSFDRLTALAEKDGLHLDITFDGKNWRIRVYAYASEVHESTSQHLNNAAGYVLEHAKTLMPF